MQHRLTVLGHIPKGNMPSVCGVEVESEEDATTFLAASEEDMERLKRILAFEIADSITNEYEEKKLEGFIAAAHPYFLPTERREVLHSAREAVQKMPTAARGEYIEKKLYHFLSHSARLSLDGFVQFRLKEYTALLKKAARAAVDVYLAEKEYAEFITLLQLFVCTGPSLIPAVHVLVHPEEGGYTLLDGQGEEIETSLYMDGNDMGALSEDDILLSTLITLSPQKLTLHGVQNLENVRLLETLMQVFEGRAHACRTCALCENTCGR